MTSLNWMDNSVTRRNLSSPSLILVLGSILQRYRMTCDVWCFKDHEEYLLLVGGGSYEWSCLYDHTVTAYILVHR